ncbi:MAG: SSU ribosomal protein S1P, partial [Parcubacteria group bacterium GW2011_GWC1_45_14]
MATKKKDILDKLAEEVDKIKEEETTPVIKKAKKAAAKEVVEESAMESLLESNPVEIPEVGDVLEGTVVHISSNSILIDLGPLGTGIVMGKEIKGGLETEKIKIGDKVGATLTDLENEDGLIELSIREASYERAWDDLEMKVSAGDIISTKVL